MQIPILNGIFTDEASDFRTKYPRNLIPVPKRQGISNGYLRPADGIVSFASGPGIDRGAINWEGQCYRVMGNNLVRVDQNGSVTSLGTIAGSNLVTMDYSFDYLSISGGGNLYLYDGATLQQNTDPDLGTVLDHVWIDGVFMTTDGQNLVLTELNDPFSVNPLKFGSSEIDPDPINGLLELRNQVAALNRNTVEYFRNTGGSGFNFQRVEGAQLQRGSVGTKCACVYLEQIAFVGSGRNEALAVWLGQQGRTQKISTREIDQILADYSEETLADCLLEARVDRNHQHLWLHLPDQTLVYDAVASQALGQPAWHILTTSIVGNGQLRARSLVYCYDRWICGDPTSNNIGVLSEDVSSHYGELNGWDFGTVILYNEGRGALIHELELVGLTGRAEINTDSVIFTRYSLDGQTWSQEFPKKSGVQGERNNRLSWFPQGAMENWRIQEFRGTSDAHASFARLQARIEGLAH